MTFIGRMVQHILPKGFQRIRYYGLHATSRASRIREELKDLLNDTSESVAYHISGNRIQRSYIKRALELTLYYVQNVGMRWNLKGYGIQSMAG